MKNWKFTDSTNTTVFFENESCSINATEIQEWILLGNTPLPADQPTPQQQRDAIQAQIKQLEDESNMNRFVREGMIEVSIKEAAVFGYTEPQLYIANYGYKLVKDLNTQITALRNQMAAI